MSDFIQNNWRPICSITLVISLCLSQFGLTNPPDKLFDLAMLVVGGHMASRGIEKTIIGSVSALTGYFKNKT